MIDYITTFKWNGLMGILLYWVPAAFCAVFYTVRTARNYMKDKADREAENIYFPTDTIGTLIGRALVSALPIANLWGALFDLAPVVFRKTFDWISTIFDQPLVPRKTKK